MKISATALALASLTELCYSFSTTNTASLKIRPASSTAILSATVEEAATYADPSRYLSDHPKNNVPPHIAALVGRGLHTRPDHPIGIIRAKIQEYFASLPDDYIIYDAEDPIVTTTQCFDDF